MIRILRSVRLVKGALLIALLCALAEPSIALGHPADQEFKMLYRAYLKQFKPLTITANRAWWDASISGKDQDFERRKKAEDALVNLHSDHETFAKLKSLRASNAIAEPLQKRLLDAMYHAFLPYQGDPELSKRIVDLGADVEQIFNTHRSVVDGERLTENAVREILKETRDTAEAQKAWRGYMQVGRKVAPKLKELVRLRNQVARQLGYANYFALQMELQEFDESELLAIFDELDRLTREPFAKLKGEIDRRAMQRFGLSKDQLRPWHTSDLFFQEAPRLSDVDLDAMYQGKDPVKLSAAYYKSIGFEVDSIIARSDLYEKEGKSPHAFCTSIDRGQDIRVLCNVKPNANWMDTVHHELGHGVYDQYLDPDLPFLLREPAHILTTEGMAMLFGALTKTDAFLRKVIGLSPEAMARYGSAARKSLTAEKLIFSRWAQVMFRFERQMYRDPDQDLNALWWALKKKYQLLNPPDDMSGADYGAKIHVVVAPVYYHNYLLGDLFASQVFHYAAKHYLGLENPRGTCFYGHPEVGVYFREKIFAPGDRMNWRELTKFATGEKLNPKYYAALFVH